MLPLFIVIEGIDGCGKTTQSHMLAEWLRGRVGDREVVETFEPGGWEGGDRSRFFLLGQGYEDSLAEFFSFLSDRCEHAARVITPALNAGHVVVCDRYNPSTIAYQIYGNSMISDDVRSRVLRLPFEIGLPEPDIVVLLDIDPALARMRLTDRGRGDAFESRGEEFFRRVKDGYEALAATAGRTQWISVDASAPEGDVFGAIADQLAPLIDGGL